MTQQHQAGRRRPVRGITLVLLGVLALAGGASWQVLRSRDQPPPAAVSQPAQPPAAAPAPGQQSVATGPVEQEPVEEVKESPDSASGLHELLPRQSIGHAQGLHKVDDRLNLGSSAALLVDVGTNQVIYSKNEAAVLPMASLTKLMTAILVVEAGQPMDEVLTITEDDVDRERNSRSRLRVGTTLTRNEALQLALMSSENRAAHALGRTYPGGLNSFVRAMNRKAGQLGMTSTTYVDPTGLSERNQSNARDLATLARAASGYELLRKYSTTPQYLTTVGQRTLQYNNSNRLVKDPDWDIDLQKTGYIIEAGHCVVMRTKVGPRDLVMVLLDAGDNRTRNGDAERLRRWFAQEAGIELTETKVVAAAPKAKATSRAGRREAKAGDKDDDKRDVKAARADKDDKPAKGENTANGEKTAKAEKSGKSARADKDEKAARSDSKLAATKDKSDKDKSARRSDKADAKSGDKVAAKGQRVSRSFPAKDDDAKSARVASR